MSALDLVAAGRVDVDLYGEQDDAPLETVATFGKYVGGSAANIVVGAARLGLRTGLVSRVGDDAFGRFVRDTLEREGVETSFVQVDAHRLTSVVALAVREVDDFPRLFFYEDSADLAAEADGVDWDALSDARCVLATGSYLIRPTLRTLTAQLLALSDRVDMRVAFDIDFRPVLWGLVPRAQGHVMDGHSQAFVEAFTACAPRCNLIVGTDSEFKAATGADSEVDAIERVRALTNAVLVVKRGHRGCVYYDSQDSAGHGVAVPGFPIDPVNAVGAGDAFFASFLARWLEGADLDECARWGNAGGAIVATRRGCTPAMPSRAEMHYFLGAVAGNEAPPKDDVLNDLHRRVGRRRLEGDTFVLAFDHRWQLEEMAEPLAARHRIQRFKEVVYDGFLAVAATRSDVGILIDDEYGAPVLARATGRVAWLGRALDVPRSYPLRLMGGSDILGHIMSWPREQIIKVLAYCHPSDSEDLWREQLAVVGRLDRATLATGHEYLVELQPSPGAVYERGDLPAILVKIYEEGLRPDWWKLPPSADEEGWVAAGKVVREYDDTCRGILILGQGSSPDVVLKAFEACAGEPSCRGFAVGRSIFREAALGWFSGEMDDATAANLVAANFEQMTAVWERLRGGVVRVG